jgi:hypothetical protein
LIDRSDVLKLIESVTKRVMIENFEMLNGQFEKFEIIRNIVLFLKYFVDNNFGMFDKSFF